MNETVILRHAEDAAFLWQGRDRVLATNRFKHTERARYDQRLDGHLDGLRIAADHGWRCAMEQWETNPDPGEAFVAAALALATPGPDHSKIEALVDGANDDGALAAVVSALGWHALRDVEPLLARWEQAADARRRYLCIAGSAVHRRHPQVGLTRFLEAEDAWVRARASRAAGELGMPAGMEPLRALLGDPEPLVHAQAAQALARLGDHRPEVRRALLEMCEAQDPGPARAAAALARLDPDQARDQFRLWAETAGARQLAIVVVETLGDPETVPQLIAWMEEDALARAAGEAFRAITGADLEYHDLIRDPPDDAGSVPNDDPDDPRVERDLEQDLPWPSPALVSRWWKAQAKRFSRGGRYLDGQSEGALAALIREGRPRNRASAALWHAQGVAAAPLAETRAFVTPRHVLPGWRG